MTNQNTSTNSRLVFKHATLQHFTTEEMLGRRMAIYRESKETMFEDSDWFTTSLSDSKMVYLLHVYETEMIPYVHNKRGGDQEVKYQEQYRGRIECDCKSFIYNDDTPRHCKHTLELSKRIFGESSQQHQRLLTGTELAEPDEWCSHLAEMDTKIYNEEKAKRIAGKLKLRETSRYARKPIEEQHRARENYARMMGRNK